MSDEWLQQLEASNDIMNEYVPNQIHQLADMIQQAQRIVVLTGAGMSTMSGIPDYRSAVTGLWNKDPNILNRLSKPMFQQNPLNFWQAYYQLVEVSLAALMTSSDDDDLIATFAKIKSNDGHHFFAWLEHSLNKQVTIITQNVDQLHQQAGSTNVIDFHGNMHECICPSCANVYPFVEVVVKNAVPQCKCGHALYPHVVFFGDDVQGRDEAIQATKEADLVLVVGTSLLVYPFSQLPDFRASQAKLVLINASSPESQNSFDDVLIGNISSVCNEVKHFMTSHA